MVSNEAVKLFTEMKKKENISGKGNVKMRENQSFRKISPGHCGSAGGRIIPYTERLEVQFSVGHIPRLSVHICFRCLQEAIDQC